MKKAKQEATEEFSGFDSLKNDALRDNLYASNYMTPTDIQRKVYTPLFLRKSLIVGAPTGSGKTLAFLLPLLDRISSQTKKFPGLRAIIMVPTYELTKQIWRECIKIIKEIFDPKQICFINKRMFKLLREPDTTKVAKIKAEFEACKILISTPVRLLRLMNMELLTLKDLSYVIVDECDKMMEKNISALVKKKKGPVKPENEKDFFNQITHVVTLIHKARSENFNTISFSFFSATPDSVKKDIGSVFDTGVQPTFEIVTVKKSFKLSGKVNQELKFCANEQGKLYEITSLLTSLNGIKFPCLIFLESRERAKDIYDEISALSIAIKFDMISSSQSEGQREKIINNFRDGSVNLLICTGLLSRGIDFKNVCTVINYDVPVTKEDYIHKVGRTGRFNSSGYALTLWANADIPYLKDILEVVRGSSEKASNKYEELDRLIEIWLNKRTTQMTKKREFESKDDNFRISNRRGERKFLKKANKKMRLDQNEEIGAAIRPWVPNRLKIKDLPSSRKKIQTEQST